MSAIRMFFMLILLAGHLIGTSSFAVDENRNREKEALMVIFKHGKERGQTIEENAVESIVDALLSGTALKDPVPFAAWIESNDETKQPTMLVRYFTQNLRNGDVVVRFKNGRDVTIAGPGVLPNNNNQLVGFLIVSDLNFFKATGRHLLDVSNEENVLVGIKQGVNNPARWVPLKSLMQ